MYKGSSERQHARRVKVPAFIRGPRGTVVGASASQRKGCGRRCRPDPLSSGVCTGTVVGASASQPCTRNRRNAGCLSLKRGFGPCRDGLARFVTRATLRAFYSCRQGRRGCVEHRGPLLLAIGTLSFFYRCVFGFFHRVFPVRRLPANHRVHRECSARQRPEHHRHSRLRRYCLAHSAQKLVKPV